MALDNREKRASAVSLNVGAPPSVTPNATHDQEWRQQSGWAYAGILVGEVVAVTPGGGFPPEVLVVDGEFLRLLQDDEEVLIIKHS